MPHCRMGSCPEPGRQRYGRRLLCPAHHTWAEQTRARIETIGYGEYHTHPGDGWPSGWANLRCFLCDATWTGPVGETCAWCERRLQDQTAGQRTLALTEPDLPLEAHPDHVDNALQAWRTRLTVAIQADIITPTEAAEVVNQWLEKHPDAQT